MNNIFRYPRTAYTPSAQLQKQIGTEKEIRKEYSRLRSIAQKRLERLGKSKYKTDLYKEFKTGFKKIRDLKGSKDLTRELAKVARFLSDDRSLLSKIKKQRENALKSLHKHGYDFVNNSNYDKFVRLMEDIRGGYKSNLLYDNIIGNALDLYEAKKIKASNVINYMKKLYEKYGVEDGEFDV